MVKRLLYATLLVGALPIIAEVTASISQNELSELETVQLSIRLEGIAPRQEPDFSALNADFDIIRNYRSGETRVTNNTFQSFVEWTLILRPKRVAELTIPSFEVGNFKTEELTIKVSPISEELTKKLDEEVFWITTVDRQEQYVHGGIHVERKLYFSSNVDLVRLGRRGLPAPEDVDNAHIVNLGVQATSWIPRNGRSYSIHTQEFVIFAERSGTLSLPQTSVAANINIDDRSVSVVVRTEPHEITILPRPDEYPVDAPWLPATNVVITDDLGELDLSGLEVGGSFSRRITIEALESYSTGVPGIEFDLPEGVRSYPATPDYRNEVLGNKIIGSRTEEQAFIVTQAGEIQIPDAELVWWNTDTKQVERTTVPGRTFTVHPKTTANVVAAGNDIGGSGTSSVSGNATSNNTGISLQTLPLWVPVLAVSGWLLSVVLAVFWIWSRHRVHQQSNAKTEEDIRLESLLKSKSGRDVKEGVLRWLTSKLELSRVDAILLLQENPTTAAALRTVNDHQYGMSSEASTLDRSEIKRALRKIEREVQQQNANTTTFWHFYQPT